MAARRDTIRVTAVSAASCLKKIPTRPPTKIRGINTTSTVVVEAITARPISLVAKIAASRGLAPLAMCWVMFSITTMASSTTRPIAMISDIIEKILSVHPAA